MDFEIAFELYLQIQHIEFTFAGTSTHILPGG